MNKKILITGAIGQIGSELVFELGKKYGQENIIPSDARQPKEEYQNFEILDVMNIAEIERIVKKHKVNVIYHLAAILSANGEKNPNFCWDVNINGFRNILDVAKKLKLKQVICPSSIAAFGPESPKQQTPQQTILMPKTMYGISKVAGELLADYYAANFDLDVRGLRYPGLISSKTLPGGGTTDYAVQIFYDALSTKKHNCFLSKDTKLPMMYMPDAIRGTIELSETKKSNLNYRNYNFAGVSFTVEEIFNEIKKHIPDFEIEYSPDFRQAIASSWPQSIDDSEARRDWNWKPKFDLSLMVKDMLEKLAKKL
jgi:threonine 3-dehydrogenase